MRSGLAGLLPLALALALGGAGCRPGGEAAGSGDPLSLHWRFSPDPPAAGPVRLALDLSDPATRQPLAGAVVKVEGNMSHPGMEPVLATASEVAPGRYEAPLTLGMAGDWIFFVDAELPDGRTLHRQIDLSGVRPQAPQAPEKAPG